MPTITGSKVKTLIEVTILELEAEANALLDKALLERAKLIALEDLTPKEATQVIEKAILGSEGFVNTWNNNIDRIVREMGKQLVAKPVRTLAQQEPGQIFAWVLGSVKSKHCPDCQRLSNMEPRTVPQWEAEGKGLPRDGLTICSVGCRCMLSPVTE